MKEKGNERMKRAENFEKGRAASGLSARADLIIGWRSARQKLVCSSKLCATRAKELLEQPARADVPSLKRTWALSRGLLFAHCFKGLRCRPSLRIH